MCTIFAVNGFIAKNFDSIVDGGMLFTNKRGLIKRALIVPPDKPLEWVSSYGSITFSQLGKEMPVSGMNEMGLVVEQATLQSTVYNDHDGKPMASCLEATQYLIDTCSSVEQALKELNGFSIVKTSWPIHFALFDKDGNRAMVEFLNGEMVIHGGDTSKSSIMSNSEYAEQDDHKPCESVEDAFGILDTMKRPDTVWSNVYDLTEGKIYLKHLTGVEAISIEMKQLDFSPQSTNMMRDIKKGKKALLEPFTEEANRGMIVEFFTHPTIRQLMNLPEPEAMINFIANQSKSYDRTNEIVLRFLEEEQIKQVPVKEAHKLLVLKYLASKFDLGVEYSEGQVNTILDAWHTFGDYFMLRRALIDSHLLRRLPNGSKYWRE